MEKVDITNSEHSLYSSFQELYSVSFPQFEQRTKEQQERAFACLNYHLIGYEENGIFVGFISYWEFESYCYIEHFAINQRLRGQSYGSRVLKNFLSERSKIVLLEIDPIVDAQSEARLRFYSRSGFFQNRYEHTHPPYRKGNKAHSLIVLTTQKEITCEEYEQFNNDLINRVMCD